MKLSEIIKNGNHVGYDLAGKDRYPLCATINGWGSGDQFTAEEILAVGDFEVLDVSVTGKRIYLDADTYSVQRAAHIAKGEKLFGVTLIVKEFRYEECWAETEEEAFSYASHDYYGETDNIIGREIREIYE